MICLIDLMNVIDQNSVNNTLNVKLIARITAPWTDANSLSILNISEFMEPTSFRRLLTINCMFSEWNLVWIPTWCSSSKQVISYLWLNIQAVISSYLSKVMKHADVGYFVTYIHERIFITFRCTRKLSVPYDRCKGKQTSASTQSVQAVTATVLHY